MQHSDSRDRGLTTALRALAEDEEGLGTSLGVEARLLAEVRSIARARRVRRRVVVYASAAALVLAISAPTWRVAVQPGSATSAPVASRVERAAGEAATDFFPLVYGSVPISNGQIVRLEVPRTALVSFGLASDSLEGSSSATVLAEVVVGEDGLARAVRFVRPLAN